MPDTIEQIIQRAHEEKVLVLVTRYTETDVEAESDPPVSRIPIKFDVTKPHVIAYGRFNPPHLGHEDLFAALLETAKELGADHSVFVSTQHDENNPLDPQTKMGYLQDFFPDINFVPYKKSIYDPLKELSQADVPEVTLVSGEDQIEEYRKGITRYLKDKGSPEFNPAENYGFKGMDFKAIPRQKPISGTKVRQMAKLDDWPGFKQCMCSKATPERSKQLFDELKARKKLATYFADEPIMLDRHLLIEGNKLYEQFTLPGQTWKIVIKIITPKLLQGNVSTLTEAQQEAATLIPAWNKELFNPKERHLVFPTPYSKTAPYLNKDTAMMGKGFWILIERAPIELGFSSPETREFFLPQGRLVFKMLKAKVIKGGLSQAARDRLPNKDPEWIWMLSAPENPIPLVLRRNAGGELRLPPKGTSWLPKSIRERIPPELRYWEDRSAQKLEALIQRAQEFVR